MPLQPPKQSRECILVYGPLGCGKTRGLVDIAEVSQQTNSDAFFWIIDTDDTFEDMADGYVDPDRYKIFPCQEYEEVEAAVAEIVSSAKFGDWCGFDKSGALWRMAQDRYVREVQKIDTRGEYFEQQAKRGGTKWQLFKGMDWNVINPRYNDIIRPLRYSCRAHLYWISSSGPLGEDASKQMKVMYGRVDLKPEGQKDLGFQAKSVLLMSRNAKGRFLTSTVKESRRERVELVEEDFTDIGFVEGYLATVGGWKYK